MTSLISEMSSLFHGYTELIIRASIYGTCPIRKSNKAVNELCRIHTKVSNNILHKLTRKKNVSLALEGSVGEGRYKFSVLGERTLDCEQQRGRAKRELKRRGNPPYDPSAYLVEEEWGYDDVV